MAPSSPTVARWELALRIKARREELGLTVQAIADHLGFSRNYWSAIENERSVLADDKFDALMKLMKFDDATVEELSALHEESRRRGWWAAYPSLDDDMQRFFGLEAGATDVRAFEGLLVPGLLQTAEYARAVIQADPFFRRVEVEQLVELRMRRQRRLSGEDPLRLTAILSEAAIHQYVSDRRTQVRQLKHLTEMATNHKETLELRLVPFAEPLGPLVTSSTLLLMDFASDHLVTLGWQEAIRPLGVIQDEEQLQRVTLGFDELLERRCLDRTSTVKRLEELADQLS